MNRPAVVVALVALAVGLLGRESLVPAQPAPARPAVPTWEYKEYKTTYADDLEAPLNRLGAEGWEVACSIPSNGRTLILKRQRR